MTESLIEEAVNKYIKEYDSYKKLSCTVADICTDIVQKNLTIRANVQQRSKSPASLAEKLRGKKSQKTILHTLSEISDLAGVRVMTYQETDRPKVVEEIKRIFDAAENHPVKIEIKDKNGKNGRYYKATHCQVSLPDEYITAETLYLKDMSCEIQVCSLLSHIYNEIEHDLQYKPKSGVLSADEKLLIDQLGLITKSGDITIQKLLEATNERLKLRKGKFYDVYDFTVRMKVALNAGDEFSKNAGLLYDEFISLKLTSPELIASHLLNTGEILHETAHKEFDKFQHYITFKQLNVKINRNTSDLLFVLLLRKEADAVSSHHSAIYGNERSARMLRIARIYNEMKSEFTITN